MKNKGVQRRVLSKLEQKTWWKKRNGSKPVLKMVYKLLNANISQDFTSHGSNFNHYLAVWKSATRALTWLAFILLVSDLDPKSTEVNKKTCFEYKIKVFLSACQKSFLSVPLLQHGKREQSRIFGKKVRFSLSLGTSWVHRQCFVLHQIF